jgi:medium-chain acyl-[acyl-carrier-protein] hydrolase
MPADFDRWIFRPLPRDGAAMRLLCVPYAGGSVVAYHGWAESLPADVDLWVLRLPGRESRVREQLRTDLLALADEATAAFVSEVDGPFCLFGHSLGALVAFELARSLRRHGRPPAHLAVSGRSAPHRPLRYPAIYGLPAEEFLTALDDRFQAIPPILREDPAIRDFYLPILRADTTMLETYSYRPEPPLDCPISAFGGRTDPEVTETDLHGWCEQTAAGFSVTMFPGGHFYLQDHRAQLLRALRGHHLPLLVP